MVGESLDPVNVTTNSEFILCYNCGETSEVNCSGIRKGHNYCASLFRRMRGTMTSNGNVQNHTAEECERSCSSASMCRMDERIRKELRYFLMNPCQKYRARKRKPYKLGIQIFKIALVTLQLVIFGQKNQDMVAFMNDNMDVFEVSMLNNRTDFFTKESVYSQLNNIRKQFDKLENSSLGNFGYSTVDVPNDDDVLHSVQSQCKSPGHSMLVCIEQYLHFTPDLDGNSIDFNPGSKNRSCSYLKPWSLSDPSLYNLNASVPLCNGSAYHINFHRLIKLELYMGLRTIRMMSPHSYHQADCYNVTICITFDNTAHSGKITQDIATQFMLSKCNHTRSNISVKPAVVVLFILDFTIIATCAISLLLCSRSLWRAQRLRKSFQRFYQRRHGKKLDWWVKLEFFNGWYILIIISDILTTLGSITKIVIEIEWRGVINYDSCSLFLGVGCLCVWIGVLRYAGFFHQYNILLLTLKKSMPHVLRFMVCASLLYLGFMFCGWVVLGPYHHKFRDPIVTSEALFSLINGDDMYMTFEEMSKKSVLAWVFSQIYLYVFISLFIYMVLSLFIAVITETYETIQEWQAAGFPPQTEIQKFLAEDAGGSDEHDYDTSDIYCCFCLYHNNVPDIDEDPSDDEVLLIS